MSVSQNVPLSDLNIVLAPNVTNSLSSCLLKFFCVGLFTAEIHPHASTKLSHLSFTFYLSIIFSSRVFSVINQ